MSDRDLLAALDACRPGESNTDDPALGDIAHRLEHDPNAQRLRDRVAAADRRLEAALHTIEVPAGLSERLLAKLSAASPDLIAAPVPQHAPRPTPIRRRMFIAGSLAATAAAVLVAINLWPQPADPWTADQVIEAAIGLYTRGERTPARPLADHPSDYPPSRDLVKLPATTQWWWLDGALADSDTVVYEINAGGAGPRGWLLAFEPSANVTGLPDRAPLLPATPTTQGVCASAWQDDQLVYVLVVEGGPSEYRQFVRGNTAPTASLQRRSRANSAQFL